MPRGRLPLPPPLQVNGRIINKRIHVRIEHVRPSRCREEFLRRCKENDEKKHAAKVAGGARLERMWRSRERKGVGKGRGDFEEKGVQCLALLRRRVEGARGMGVGF